MNARRTVVALAILASSFSFARSASAQYGGGCANFGCGIGYGGYLGVGDLYRVLSQNVPHFAAFPPVYYSVPVARTYGYSPFAYLPHVQTPEVSLNVQPAVIQNPYFRSSESTAPVQSEKQIDQTTQIYVPKPLEIRNQHAQNDASAPVLQASR